MWEDTPGGVCYTFDICFTDTCFTDCSHTDRQTKVKRTWADVRQHGYVCWRRQKTKGVPCIWTMNRDDEDETLVFFAERKVLFSWSGSGVFLSLSFTSCCMCFLSPGTVLIILFLFFCPSNVIANQSRLLCACVCVFSVLRVFLVVVAAVVFCWLRFRCSSVVVVRSVSRSGMDDRKLEPRLLEHRLVKGMSESVRGKLLSAAGTPCCIHDKQICFRSSPHAWRGPDERSVRETKISSSEEKCEGKESHHTSVAGNWAKELGKITRCESFTRNK